MPEEYVIEEVNVQEMDFRDMEPIEFEEDEPYESDDEGMDKALVFGAGMLLAYLVLRGRRAPTPAEIRADAIKNNIYE